VSGRRWQACGGRDLAAESIIGSVFEGWVRIVGGRVRPQVRGDAYVNAESTLLIDAADPFALGIRP